MANPLSLVPRLHRTLPRPEGPSPTFPVAPPPEALPTAPSDQAPTSLLTNLAPILFALGARMGGSPTTGAAALQGFQQGQALEAEEAERARVEAQRKRALEMESARLALQFEAEARQQQARAAQERREALQASVEALRQQTFPNKAAYDQALAAHETMLTTAYGVPPNRLRTLVPFNAGTAQAMAAKALEPMIREYGLDQVVKSQGFVELDRDGDGVPERVPMADALRLAGIAVMRDPNGQVVLAPKGTTQEKADELTEIFKGVLGQWQADGKAVSDPGVRGRAMEEAVRRQKALGREGAGQEAVNWETRVTDQGLVQIHPRTGQTRPLTAGGRPLQAPSASGGNENTRTLAALVARSPDVLQGLTPTLAGTVMTEMAANPELLTQYEQTRMAPLRERSQALLSAVEKLVTIDPSGQTTLTPGAKLIFGEYTPVSARSMIPGPEATDAAAALEQVLGQQVVDLISDMKAQSRTGATGFGQLSVRELEVLQSAATQLTRRLSEPAALRELVAIQQSLQKILKEGPRESGGASVPTDVASILASEPNGRYTLSDGSVWIKRGTTIIRGGG